MTSLPPNLAQRQPVQAACVDLLGLSPAPADPIPIDWPWEPRLAWWPRGRPVRPLVAIVGSRLPRALDTVPELFRQVRASVAQAQAAGQCLIVAEGTPLAEIVDRAATLQQAELLRIRLAARNESLSRWLGRVGRCMADLEREDQQSLLVSPPLRRSLEATCSEIPVSDRIVAAVAGQLDVVRLRRNGNWERLLAWIDQRPGSRRPAIRVAIGRQLVPSALARAYLDQGARDATLAEPAPEVQPAIRGVETRPVEPTLAPVLSTVASALPADYLIHATRRCAGPWPGQKPVEYLDELLHELPTRDRSARATLVRMLAEGRIRASRRGIRGGRPVVCLGQIRLDELAARRVWRKHRGRWDFEPFGLAIDRQWLIRQGARPVIYGDDAVWRNLSEDDRPFFQWAGGSAAPHLNSAPLDWRREREWRVCGDIDLAAAPPACVVVFVADPASRCVVQQQCRFPVVVVPHSSAVRAESTCRF